VEYGEMTIRDTEEESRTWNWRHIHEILH